MTCGWHSWSLSHWTLSRHSSARQTHHNRARSPPSDPQDVRKKSHRERMDVKTRHKRSNSSDFWGVCSSWRNLGTGSNWVYGRLHKKLDNWKEDVSDAWLVHLSAAAAAGFTAVAQLYAGVVIHGFKRKNAVLVFFNVIAPHMLLSVLVNTSPTEVGSTLLNAFIHTFSPSRAVNVSSKPVQDWSVRSTVVCDVSVFCVLSIGYPVHSTFSLTVLLLVS